MILTPVAAISTNKNKFVHLALQKTIALSVEAKGSDSVLSSLKNGLDIAIVGDNDFYSQRVKVRSVVLLALSVSDMPHRQLEELNLPRTLESLTKIPPFVSTNVRLSDVHKTGLGSSASLITSLTSALLVHLGVIPESALSEDDNEGRRLAHNLAQYVHCQAQGKVGSGFDVSAAVFGSHLYTRFDPSVISELMNESNVCPLPVTLVAALNPRQGWSQAASCTLILEPCLELPNRTIQASAAHSNSASRR